MRAFWRLVSIAVLTATTAAATPPPRPRLVVVIAVDQFSGALFDQYRGRFTGGLKTLAGGAVFANGYQSHAATETCPGHSTLLTGRHPSATGIVANTWYDPDTGTQAYCVFDPAGPVPGRDGQPRGPANLKVPTLGEWLKAANPTSRVVAVSGKDRAAITMAGHSADGVFWWDDERGFTTSLPAGSSEAARLAPVAAFNAALIGGWRKAAPVWRPSGVCTGGGDSKFGALTIANTLPPAAPEGSWNDPAALRYFRASPGLDEATLALAGQLVEHFKLGRGPAPDVLAISLSATDYVGHRYGNEGPEMCDQLAHLDRALGSFLKQLTALNVPVIVALTADHGALDAVERVASRGVPAQRLNAEAAFAALGRAVQTELGLDFAPLAGDPQQISIAGFGDPDPARDARIAAATIARLKADPDVAAVFTRAQVLAAVPRPGTPPDELTLAERFNLSADARRSGDIIVAYRPLTNGYQPRVFGDTVAGHGTPWNYDRRVPMLFWWPGVTGFEQPLPVETVDIAPTLAALLGVAAPKVDGRCLDLDGGAGDSCSPRPGWTP